MILKTLTLFITLTVASSHMYGALRLEEAPSDEKKAATLSVSSSSEQHKDQEENRFQRKNCCQFFLSFLMHPLRMGSIAPISSNCAKLMAMPVKNGDKVLELGAGTGAVTREIIKNTAANQVFCVELGQEFINPLQSEFPESNILQGNAKMLGKALFTEHTGTFDVVVSTLPLRCMSAQDYDQIIMAALSMLKENGTFVQITPYLMSPAIADYRNYGLSATLVGRADYCPNPWVIWSFKRAKIHLEQNSYSSREELSASSPAF